MRVLVSLLCKRPPVASRARPCLRSEEKFVSACSKSSAHTDVVRVVIMWPCV